MAILAMDRIFELIDLGQIIVESTDSNYPFDPHTQVTNAGLDLRLSDMGFIIKGNCGVLSTLYPPDPLRMYEKILIPIQGYKISPGGFLLTSTLETVFLAPNQYIGRITGRSVFSRMGLAVHCTQQKFSSGNTSIIPLQLINHSPIPLIVYPRQKIVALQIELVSGTAEPYKGKFSEEKSLRYPFITSDETNKYNDDEIRAMKSSVLNEEATIQRSVYQKIYNWLEIKRNRIVYPLLLAISIGICSSLIAGGPSNDVEINHYKYLAIILSLFLAIVFYLLNLKGEK